MRKPYAFRRFLILVPALLLGALAAYGDTSMTKIKVLVTTQGGRPIDRAEVVVNFVQGRSVVKFGKAVRTSYDLRTNQDGEATIPSIPQGKIKVLVNAKGYQTYGKVLDINEEEKTIEVKLNTPQPQYSAH